jgi:hypothetical protein
MFLTIGKLRALRLARDEINMKQATLTQKKHSA